MAEAFWEEIYREEELAYRLKLAEYLFTPEKKEYSIRRLGR